ncbi:MAG TPA: BON domain-containing protein [Chloroflexota bacterium]|nr:BON domain-containing protein [Chloroflexota bacterium]
MTAVESDARIRQDVLDELRHDVRIDASNITVDVHSGVVRLSGTVPTYFQKVTAGHAAERIKGVRGVANELNVTLVAPWTDQEIAATVRANLARDVRISNPGQITVGVENGVVTLTGTVPTYTQKSDAADDAWRAPGVVDVVNALAVAPPISRADAEIAADVRDTLARDPTIDAANIAVTVANGTVYLRGTVPTYYQAQQAANDAWGVPGVVDVVNELGVSF